MEFKVPGVLHAYLMWDQAGLRWFQCGVRGIGSASRWLESQRHRCRGSDVRLCIPDIWPAFARSPSDLKWILMLMRQITSRFSSRHNWKGLTTKHFHLMGAAWKSVSTGFRNRKSMRCVELFDHFIYFLIPFRVCWQKFENRRGRSREIFQNVSLTKRRFNDVTIAWYRNAKPRRKDECFRYSNCSHKVAQKFRFSDRR